MRFRAKKALLALIFSASFFSILDPAEAFFSLSASPRRGGQHIRFEGAKPGSILRNEEVTIEVTTDRAAQYRIYQTMYQPLTNEFGQTIPQGNFVVFSPSSPLGTLRTQLETPITMGQIPIFTSNNAGDSDSFILVFNVHVPEDQPGGVYRTQVSLMAELVSPQSGVSPSVVHMEVRVEITPTFKVEIKSDKGTRSLDLGRITKDRPAASGVLNIQIDSNIGSVYRITQQMTEPLISQAGVALESFDFVYQTSGLVSTGIFAEVPDSQMPLYTSSEAGEGGQIQVQYEVRPDPGQKAGIYTGTLSFSIDSRAPTAQAEVISIPVRLEIEPIFYLDIELEKGGSLSFGTFRTGEERQEQRAVLTVYSNLGEPYQVSQIVPRKMTNQEGAVIPKEHFQFFGSEAKTGVLTVMSPTPVEEGEKVVFTSNPAGDPEKFVLNYILTIPREAKAGSYSSEVRYSITTL